MGLFDDLIPANQASPQAKPSPGMFDDLVPQKPKVDIPDLSQIDDEKQLLGELGRLPPEQKQAALEKWAQGRVALDRQGFSSAAKRTGDAISRISQAVPVLGGLTDEAEAALHRLNGGDYDVQLAYSRARNKVQNEAETPKISTPLGDIYESGAEKALGAVSGALALPFARVTSGTGALPGAADAVVNAVPYAAADAFTRGEGGFEERLNKALETIPAAAGESALLGGALGKLQRQFQPNAQGGPSGPSRNQIVTAADQEGVTFPDFLASDSQTKKNIAGALASQPLTGPIIRNAADDTALQMGNRLNRVADDYSSTQGTGITAGTVDPAAASLSAGGQVRDSISDWITHQAPNDFSNDYANLHSQLSPTATVPLGRTQVTARALEARGAEAATPVEQQAVDRVRAALDRPQGLTVQGAMNLRTYINNLRNSNFLPEGGTTAESLNGIYNALTTDIGRGMRRLGGPAVEAEWNRINQAYAEFAGQRESLTRIIGTDANAPAERIVDRLITMAGTKSGADMQQLLLARAAVNHNNPLVWGELSSAAVRRLGQGGGPQAGSPGAVTSFSPDRFMTAWGKLSDNGKAALFGGPTSGTLRASLDNIALMSDRFRDIRRFQNPSGTAQVMGATSLLGQLAATLAGHTTAGATAVGQVAGAGLLSYLLSRPAGAHSISSWGSAYTNWLSGAGSLPMMKLATLTLAKHVSDVTGEDEKSVADRLGQMAGVR